MKKEIKDIQIEALEEELENLKAKGENLEAEVSELAQVNEALKEEKTKMQSSAVVVPGKPALTLRVDKKTYIFPYPKLRIGEVDMTIEEIAKDTVLLGELVRQGSVISKQ